MAAGDYEIVESLHDGRLSQVFRALRRRDGARVIVKAYRREASDRGAWARVEREVEVLRRCAGPATPELIGLERWDRSPVLVVRDDGGTALHRFRRGRDLSLVARLDLALAMCDALAVVHAAGVVHRDLKPANIVVLADGARVQLIDFGAVGDGEGTLQYMSPEQTGRTGRAVDARSDHYALGVVLYELLTDRLPFAGDDPLELAHAHLARVPVAPAALVPDLGDSLSGLVMRLLEKSPEHRYQTLGGLRHDLARCRDALARGERPDFALGARDRRPGLQLPATLFGRERERDALLSEWTAVRGGARSLALVAGASGSGKSSLLRALAAAVGDGGGRFVSGRFEQVERDIPYAGLLAALDQLLRRLLGEPDDRLATTRAALLSALGDGAGGLADVLPTLALITGPLARPPEPESADSTNRFHAAITRLLRVFAGPHVPLVLAVDDLQWADPATLRLLDALAREPTLDHLLIVGCFRDDEVAPHSPLRSLPAAVRVSLGPLTGDDVRRLIAETLAWPEDQAEALAAAVAARTDGNPLFVRAYLRWLFDQGLLVYASERGAWEWDAARTAAAAPGDDLVALMTRRLAALADDTRAALEAAACIGARFGARRLAALLGRPADAVLAALDPAIERGLLQPAGVAVLPGARVLDTVFEFVHDKVQQAAYHALAPDARLHFHLELGRALLRDAGSRVLEDMLFEITGHLNLAAAGITDPAERLRLAELDLAAGRKASRSAAFATAVQHLRQGIAALPDGAWSTHYSLAFALHRDCMECEHYAGDPAAAAARFEPLLARARTDVDRAELYYLKVALLTDGTAVGEAIAAGRAGLALLGVELPALATRTTMLSELAAIRWHRGLAPLDALAKLPEARDRGVRLALRLLGLVSVSAYQHQADLSTLCMLRSLRLSLRHGVTADSALAVALYGFAHLHQFDDPDSARILGHAAETIARRFNDPHVRVQMAIFCTTHVRQWIEPTAAVSAELLPEIEHALQLGKRAPAVSLTASILYALWLGPGDVEQIAAHARWTATIGSSPSVGWDYQNWHVSFQRGCMALRGETEAPTSMAGPDWDEAAFAAELPSRTRTLQAAYALVKLTLLYHHGAWDEAAALIARMPDARFVGAVIFIDQLTLTLLVHTARGERLPRDVAARLDRWLGHLRRWNRLHADHVEDRLLLAEADLARCRGDRDEAARLYARAVEAAHRVGHLRIEALALERAGRHAHADGSHVLTDMYLGAAVERYERWGAPTIAAHLRREFPRLAPPPLAVVAAAVAGPPSTGAASLDVAALLRSTQAITGELVLDRLLRVLVRTLVEIAGARRCFVLLLQDGALQVAAAADVAAARLDVRQSHHLSDEPSLPQSVVHFVARTRRDVVLADATVDPDFAADPALSTQRSVLCAPILHHGELFGVLYLDNDLAPALFDSARLALLRHLAAQIATSIDNARLYDDLARARDAAVRADRLKTRFLLNMSHELRTPLTAVIGYAELIRESAAEGDLEAVDADTEKIRRAAGRLVRTLTTILELSRLEADTVAPVRVPVDLAAIVRDSVAACEAEARERDDVLALDLAADLPALVGDPGMLTHCVHTLVDNAVRFTRRGRVDVSLRVVDDAGARSIALRVADTGTGIAEADLARLFVSFQPLDDSTTRARDGSGVSLAVAQRFARLLGGAIEVTSTPGRGSTFTLRLPAPLY